MSGRRWAYFTLTLMLILSIAGNVAHTIHLDPSPSALSITRAVIWPGSLFLAVEMFMRVPWQPKLTHRLVRWGGILAAAFIAAFVSYRHLRGLMLSDGEETLVANVGPLVIDGLMLMSTLAILLTRPAPGVLTDDELEQILERHTAPAPAEVEHGEQLMSLLEQERSIAPVSPAPIEAFRPVKYDSDVRLIPVEQSAPKDRPVSTDMEQRVRSLLTDPELRGDNSTMRRYAKVARQLRDNPQAEVDCSKERVRPELVSIIRNHMNLERVR